MGRGLRFLIFLLFQWMSSGFSYPEEFEMPDGWVDPTDMGQFDYGAETNNVVEDDDLKTLYKESSEGTGQHNEFEERDIPDEKENDPDVKGTNDSEKDTEANESRPKEELNCDYPFLRRHVAVLYKELNHVAGSTGVENFDLSLRLERRNWLTLKEFVDDCGANIQEVTRVLEDMVTGVHVRVEDEFIWKKKFEDFIHMPFEEFLKLGVGVLIIVAILTLQYLSHISWTLQLKRLVIVAFIISLCMTYIHELKLAEAEYISKSTDIPKECLGNSNEEVSTWQGIKSVFTDFFSVKEDPCKQYHANFLITPAMKITPTKVLAVTVTRFAVEPMEHVGTAFSKAFKNIFAGLPVTLWIPAFIFVTIGIVGFLLVVSVCFGYNLSLNLPFWAGLQMGPQQMIHHDPEINRVMDDYRRRIDQLEDTNRDLKSRLHQQALPAPQPSPSRAQAILSYIGLGRGDNPNAPPGHANPPPYPAADPPNEANLPYPDFGVPQYPPEDGRHFAPGGCGDMGGPVPGTQGLRRRHTAPTARQKERRYSGNSAAPYSPQDRGARDHLQPPGMDQNPIGFEHLMEQQDESKTVPVMRRTEPEIHQQTSRTTGPGPVEDLSPVTRGAGVRPKKVQTSRTSPNSKVTKKVLPDPVRSEAPTLPVEEVDPVVEDDGPDFETWEKISPDESTANDDGCPGEKKDSFEWQDQYKREAEAGFQSTE